MFKDANNTVAILTGLFTLLGTLLGGILGFAAQRFDRYWEDIERFRMAKALLIAIPQNSIVYPKPFPHLRRLKRFFIKHPKYYNRKKENKEFFDKWLTNN